MKKTLSASFCATPLFGLVVLTMFTGPAAASDNNAPILPQLASSPLSVISTVPANGDLNPYGVVFVPSGFAAGGIIHAGDILVSNFNNSANFQGTGTTIVAIGPDGSQRPFFRGPAGLGLTTALGILHRSIVLVGNLPTTDGTFGTVQPGSLIAIDRSGKQIANFANAVKLDGPWDLAVAGTGERQAVFVSDALSGEVTRLVFNVSADGENISIQSATVVADGYTHRGDPSALVIGPTGLAFDIRHNVLYVASTGDNAIYAIDNAADRTTSAGKGTLVYQDAAHLRGPLGLVLAENGNLIASNGDAINGDPNHPSELIEFTRAGQFVAAVSVDTGGQGGAFGIALAPPFDAKRFAAVDDVTNTLKIWKLLN